MTSREHRKEESRRRILDAAARRLRREGPRGGAIQAVMKDAGLTHGAFYAHFANKDELAAAALRHALAGGRSLWTDTSPDPSWARRLKRLARRYLTPDHRDNPDDSCAFGAIASEAARGPAAFRLAYEEELKGALAAVQGEGGDDEDDAIAFLALCVGGIALARTVEDKAFSEKILAACRAAAPKLRPKEGPP